MSWQVPDHRYDHISDRKEWNDFDSLMCLLEALGIISNEEYLVFPDRTYIKKLLIELKDVHEREKGII
jgi:hypothetical protein